MASSPASVIEGFYLLAQVVQDVAENDLGALFGHQPGFFSPLPPGAATDDCYFAIQSSQCSTRPFGLAVFLN